MPDSEFYQSLVFDRWVNTLPRRTVCLQESFEVFREDLYSMIMDKISTSQYPDAAQRPYWTDLLWRYKKWASGDSLDVERARQFPVVELAGRYGLEVKRGMTRCPFHPDKTPSLSIDTKRNRWHCFGACGTGWGSIDIVMMMQKCDFVTAVKALT